MNKIFSNKQYWMLVTLILFSFFVNFYYANIGVLAIDTFAFFDTAYNILLKRHPFKDIWVTTGPLVDYLQAISFKVFGFNWTSYVIHGSILNVAITLSFYFTLLKLGLNQYLSFFYSICLATLCYVISGTPFAYIHSYVFSLISIMLFFISIKYKSGLSFFILPVFMFLSFFSMQTPSTYVNVIILFSLSFYFFYKFKLNLVLYFLLGSFFSLFAFIFYIYYFEIPSIKLIQQYILFPLSMGESRLLGNETATISFLERFTFRNVIGHFKFINILILLLFVFTLTDLLKRKINKITIEDLIINFSIIFLGITLIFNQLITSNQTYIFSLIPFIGAFFQIYLKNRYPNLKSINYFLVLLVLFSTIKYHEVYNTKRKFMDLQQVDLNKSINAELLEKRFKNLKWITPDFPENPKKEINLLREALDEIKKDKRIKMVMTNYQFFSLLLQENLNIPNRWYTHDNISYPLKNHRYFKFYQEHFSENILKNDIEVVYTVGDIDFENYKVYLENICFDKLNLNTLTNIYKIKNCT